ncbi:MAG TPA: aldo/keto reductase [Actinoplanes sp.]|nr:aldo/keto reductase [Actinoplanes sp.]
MTIARREHDRCDLSFTELGFGGAELGNLATEMSDEQAWQALSAAWDAGIRYVDTAPHYGLGLSERRIGAWLAATRSSRQEPAVLSTKVGRALVPIGGAATGRDDEGFAVPATHRRVRDYSADGVRRSLEGSLERLGVDRIDVALVHDPEDHWQQASREAVPALVRLRDEGMIRAVGVGMNQAEMLTRFVRETDVDVVMLAGRLTLLDHTGLRELLPTAHRRGVGVLSAGVFNSGVLASEVPRHGATFDYRPAPAHLLQRARRFAAICREHGTTLPTAALHYALRHPAVLSAVIGMRSAAEAKQNFASYAAPPPASLWAALAAEGVPDPTLPTGR